MFKVDLATVPEDPGVYQFKDSSGKVLYVGKAGNLRARLSSYRPGQVEPRKESMLERAADLELILTSSEKEALLLESNLIKRHQPRYNVRLTDDKRYPFILLTDHEYPRVRIVRDTKLGGRLFGPFPDAGAAWRTLKTMQEVFRLRDCKELIPGGCLNYQMKLCWAPCILDPADRQRKTADRELSDVDPKARYAQAADEAGSFLRGDMERLTTTLSAQMEEAASRQHFERAARARDRLQAVTTTLQHQSIFARGKEDRDAFLVHQESGAWVGIVVLMRRGMVAGQETYFFRHTAADTAAEVLHEFIARYYEHLPNVPREVLVPEMPRDAEALAALLAEKREGPVEFRIPQRGDLKAVLEHARRNAEFRLGQERLRRGEADSQRELLALQQELQLPTIPRRIECFDISHLGGTGVVASMSVLVDGRAAPGQYRRFKLSQEKNDDFAAMEEVVRRRYSRVLAEGQDLPDLILIDGGMGQLKAAKHALDALGLDAHPVASLAKKEEEVYRPGLLRPLRLGRTHQAMLPLLRVRDEAHRFALAYQRASRKKQLRETALDAVPGLGPAKKRILLSHYASVDEVLKAREADLARIPGIGPKLAAAIVGTLRRDEAREE
ncbi:MAG TPA: excinuclease ABC subunit UvrC [Candidatus Thermoplasmatota archaeon]|nr:excinuclease ABC subunit UvrC [Candidatus Thermoplasmatota archaeon]